MKNHLQYPIYLAAAIIKLWVTPSFKEILRDNCWEYLDSNDLGKSKDRTAVVDRVAEEIARVAAKSNQRVPEMLNKVFEFEFICSSWSVVH
jgi:hypothetical protein